MKNISLFIFSILCSAVGYSQVPTQVVNETFTFTGALNANGWTSHSGTAGQLVADGNVANLVAGNSEDLNKAFSASYPVSASMTNKADYSVTINVASAIGLSTAGDYFLGLGGSTGTTLTTLYARLYIKGSATGYTLGILNNSGGTATPTYGVEIPYGTPANVTATYIIDNSVSPATQVATLQINSQPLLSNSTGTTAPATTLASVFLRQGGSATSGTGNISIDNFVANTYSAYLGVSDINVKKSNFIKNTFVQDEIQFASKATVKVYNMNGQVLKVASVSEFKNLDVQDLAPGMYIVTGNVNGEEVSQKILKK